MASGVRLSRGDKGCGVSSDSDLEFSLSACGRAGPAPPSQRPMGGGRQVLPAGVSAQTAQAIAGPSLPLRSLSHSGALPGRHLATLREARDPPALLHACMHASNGLPLIRSIASPSPSLKVLK